MSFVLGLTGQTGGGKSTVSQVLIEAGIPVIDADQVARQVVELGRPALSEIAAAFGKEIIQEGALDRRALGRRVFSNTAELKKLNGIIFPYICEEIKARISTLELGGANVIVLDAPTLFESGADRMCDEICGVISPKETRLARILQRDGLTQEEATERIRSQHDDHFFYERCHVIIENSGTLEELRKSARKLAAMLKGKVTCQNQKNPPPSR